MQKIKVSLSIGFAGATHNDILEISDIEWQSCISDNERNDLMYSYWQDWANNYIDGGFQLIKGDTEE